VLVLGGAVLARAVIAATTPPTVVAPPALSPLDAIAVAHPEAGATLTALDGGNGHLVALAAPRERTCPPVGTCPAPPAPDAFVVLDDRSGQSIASTPLGSDPATGARSLVVDPAAHQAFAVAPQAVTIFSTETGARVGGFALPAELASGQGTAQGAALDPVHGTLALSNGRETLLVRTDSGQEVAGLLVGGGILLDGPIVDVARGRIYLLLAGSTAADQPQLFALDALNLFLRGQYPLPAGARLGPLDAADANLAVFGADGTTWQLPLDALSSGKVALTPMPELRNALALGENPALGHRYVADASQTHVLDAFGAIAALPLGARGSPAVPLMVDTTRGLLYLPAEHGTIVIVQDRSGAPAGRALTPTAAVLLAQAAFWHIWSDGQDPAFFTPATFPMQPGMRAQDFWFDDPNHGWQGPFAGQASTQVTTNAGGGYRVTFAIGWTQLFTQQHTWVWDIAPDGGARLVSASGDTVP
jgi:hypothetical protein